MLKAAATDLANRRPVWDALGELFLDTDRSYWRKQRVSTLATSPYNLEEIEHILFYEVYPILKWNLLSIAGEWVGFDEKWLEEQIMRRLESPYRFFHIFNFGRLSFGKDPEWLATKLAIAQARSGSTSAL